MKAVLKLASGDPTLAAEIVNGRFAIRFESVEEDNLPSFVCDTFRDGLSKSTSHSGNDGNSFVETRIHAIITYWGFP